jgi:hypothetical protein
MRMARRIFIAGGAALALTASASRGQTAARTFTLFHGNSRIGSQNVSVTRQGDGVDVRIGVDVAVRLFGLTVYRYSLNAQERWQGGRLERLVADTDNNGGRSAVRASRDGDALAVEGTRFSGRVVGNPATTSYWSPAFLEREIWIDLEDGRPRRVTTQRLGTGRFPAGTGSVEAARWRIGGDIAPIDLFFDGAGEWVGSEFQARGETARFVLAERGGALTRLWHGG